MKMKFIKKTESINKNKYRDFTGEASFNENLETDSFPSKGSNGMAVVFKGLNL
jgi:hypothetical protein